MNEAYPRDMIGYGRTPPDPKWPDGAAETWSTASEMATRIGRAESDRLGASLVPPGSVAE